MVPYDPTLRDQVLDLQRHLWGADAGVRSAYFEWKYERNPYTAAPIIHLALCDGQALGMRGHFGTVWEAGTPPRQFVALSAGDLVTDPEHRNLELVTRIMTAAARDLDGGCGTWARRDSGERDGTYAFNLSASLPTQLASLLTGWRSVGQLETARLDHPSPHRETSTAEDRFLPLDAQACDHPTAGGGRVRVEARARPAAMAAVVRSLGSDGRIRHVRDERYFAWRFQNPLSRYRFLLWVEDAVEGYLVLQTPIVPTDPAVTIVDWEGTSDRVRHDLLNAAVTWGRFKILKIWCSTLSAAARRMLERAGFKTTGESRSIGGAHRVGAFRPVVLARRLNPAHSPEASWKLADRDVLDLAHWDVRGLYSDTF